MEKKEYPENTIRLAKEMGQIFSRELLPLFMKKNSNYSGTGHFDNIGLLGEKGVLARVVDKTSRLYNILWEGLPNAVEDETVEDTWRDLIVYGFIALLVRRGLWEKKQESGS